MLSYFRFFAALQNRSPQLKFVGVIMLKRFAANSFSVNALFSQFQNGF